MSAHGAALYARGVCDGSRSSPARWGDRIAIRHTSAVGTASTVRSQHTPPDMPTRTSAITRRCCGIRSGRVAAETGVSGPQRRRSRQLPGLLPRLTASRRNATSERIRHTGDAVSSMNTTTQTSNTMRSTQGKPESLVVQMVLRLGLRRGRRFVRHLEHAREEPESTQKDLTQVRLPLEQRACRRLRPREHPATREGLRDRERGERCERDGRETDPGQERHVTGIDQRTAEQRAPADPDLEGHDDHRRGACGPSCKTRRTAD